MTYVLSYKGGWGEEEHQTTKTTTATAIITVEFVTISLAYANSFKYKEIIDVNTH